MQAQMNIQTAQASSQGKIEELNIGSQVELVKIQADKNAKLELLDREYALKMELEKLKLGVGSMQQQSATAQKAEIETEIEDRKDENIGFIYPKILSIENRHHIHGTLFLTENNSIEKAQFAGLVVNAKGIQSVGLPIHSFFIYFDDWEYTLRLTQNGYIGIHSPHLFAWHNDGVRAIGKPWLSAPKKDIWKSLYGIRNELVFYKKKGLWVYAKLLLKHVLLTPISILFHRKENALYVAIKWSLWSFKSLFFNYTIDKVNSENVKRFETNYVR
jgi:GT2 family glycosyltransferase